MDWLKGMNDVVGYIEENLTQIIQYESLSRIVGCSVCEFSRIFSFMAGMSISEYIRRRRLSQAVFDIQNGDEKIIDIAMKYCYESPTTFTRAFKKLHGTTPLSARQTSVNLKTYPVISFVLNIKGVEEMNFRIEKKDSFIIVGKVSTGSYDHWCQFDKNHLPYLQSSGFIRAPFWYVGAYFLHRDEEKACMIGAEFNVNKIPEGMEIENIPATTWAVFPFAFKQGEDAAGETYARVVTEWLPTSHYTRNEAAPYLEVYGNIENTYEVWVPVQAK